MYLKIKIIIFTILLTLLLILAAIADKNRSCPIDSIAKKINFCVNI